MLQVTDLFRASESCRGIVEEAKVEEEYLLDAGV